MAIKEFFQKLFGKKSDKPIGPDWKVDDTAS